MAGGLCVQKTMQHIYKVYTQSPKKSLRVRTSGQLRVPHSVFKIRIAFFYLQYFKFYSIKHHLPFYFPVTTY